MLASDAFNVLRAAPQGDTADMGLFFHGTPVAVHLQKKPFLDPNLAKGGDEGDPVDATGAVIPHVFLTRDIVDARMFAIGVRMENTMIKSRTGNNEGPTSTGAILVFRDITSLSSSGFVYGFEQSCHKAFEETMARGKGTGRFVFYEALNVRSNLHETVDGLQGLVRSSNIQAYLLANRSDERLFWESWENKPDQSDTSKQEVLRAETNKGRLIRLQF